MGVAEALLLSTVPVSIVAIVTMGCLTYVWLSREDG